MTNIKDLKSCFKQHPTTHTVFGIGLGLVLVGLVPVLGTNALILGVVVALGALAYDNFMVKE